MNQGKLFYKGDIVFKEGDLSHEIYLIKAGCVQIFQVRHCREIEIARLMPGDIFGEMAIFENTYRSATARVVEDALIHVIPTELVNTTIESNPIWFKALMRVLTTRLRGITSRYNEEISEYHPFKYMNFIAKKKLAEGTPPEKIAREFNLMLTDPDYKELSDILHQMFEQH